MLNSFFVRRFTDWVWIVTTPFIKRDLLTVVAATTSEAM